MAMLATVTVAGPVTLALKDNSFAIKGTLLSFDDGHYKLDTDLGVLTFAAETTRCTGTACPDLDKLVPTLRFAASPSLGELLLPSLIESFAARRGYRLRAAAADDNTVRITLHSPQDKRDIAHLELMLMTGLESFAALATGRADIVFSRRAPTTTELKALTLTGMAPLRSQIVGWETLRLYGQTDNPTQALTVRQITAMTDGSGTFWPGQDGVAVQLHGDTDNIIALHQQLDRVVRDPLLPKSRHVGQGTLFVTPNLSLPHKHIPVSANCGSPVAYDENSFGAHPLQAPIRMYSANRWQSKTARDFGKYVLTVPAQRAVARSGFQSRTPSESRLESDQSVLLNAVLNSGRDVSLIEFRDAVRRLKDYGRLSLTFRFQGGSNALDDVSKSNLRFLSELLQQGRYANREVLFAGFSDSSGGAEANLRLSKSRAETLRDTILALMGDRAPHPHRFIATGFGEVLPLACNDTAWGQHQNRRVEIWLR